MKIIAVFQQVAEIIAFTETVFVSPFGHGFVPWYQLKNLGKPLIEIKSSFWLILDDLSRSFHTFK